LWHHSHRFCTEKEATCCTWCTVKQPWICCHSCNPSTLVLNPSDPSHIPRGRTKWKVKVADYNMQDNDIRLQEHLCNWHKTALVGQGHGSDMFFGPQRILSDQLITLRGHPSISLLPLSSPTFYLCICISPPHLCTISKDCTYSRRLLGPVVRRLPRSRLTDSR
jgi:hypothetical protein